MMTIPRSIAATLTLACFLAAPACSAPLPGQQQPAQRAARGVLDTIIGAIAPDTDPDEFFSDAFAFDDARDAVNRFSEEKKKDVEDAFAPVANAIDTARDAGNAVFDSKMPEYGRHCGTMRHSEAKAIDEVDQCCKQHDRCTCKTGPKGMWFGDCDCETDSYRCMVEARCPKFPTRFGRFPDWKCLAAKAFATKFFEMNKDSFCEASEEMSYILGRSTICLE